MNFYIKEIKLWFKTHTQPKSYFFKKNKVNVITGDSSTGKSSILQIIDYCLLAPESAIVEDVINRNVSWYGLSFNLNGHDFAIARKAPSETGIAAKDFYWAEDTELLPDDYPIPTPEVTRASLLTKFNREFQCEGLSVKKENKDKEFNLSFRSFLMLNYLTEEIIATNHSYLDSKFFGNENLEAWEMEIFKLSIGMQEIEEEKLEKLLNSYNLEINRQDKNKRQDKRNQERYNKLFNEILEKARQLRLLNPNVECTDLREEIIQNIKTGIQQFNRFINSKRNAKYIESLKEKDEEINRKIKNYNLLRAQYNRAKRYAEKAQESLSPIQFFTKDLSSVIMAKETIQLLNSLDEAYRSTTQIDIPEDYLPDTMEKDLEYLKNEQKKIKDELDSMKVDIERAYNVSWLHEILDLEHKLKELKPVTAKYCGDESLIETQDIRDKTEKERDELRLNNEEQKKLLLNNIQSYYDIQDGMSENYRNMEVCLHDEKVILKLKKNGNFYPMNNVGSKSNFMFMHLCFFLGLHERLIEVTPQRVANFLFIDQPSIPYYGTNKRRNGKDDQQISNREDEARLRSAFKLIDSFMTQNISEKDSRDFQIILIEHANPVLWEDCTNFETRYIFTIDKDYGLIPNYIYE